MLMTVILLAEDDGPTKLAKVEIPSSVVPGSLGVQFSPQSTLGAMRPVYVFYSKIILHPPVESLVFLIILCFLLCVKV